MRIPRLGIIVSLLVASGPAWAKSHKPVVYQNIAPGVAYTGSKSCTASGCHSDLNDVYRHTPMGNSMVPASAPSELSKVPGRITIYSKELDRYFEVMRVGSDIYQSEYQLDEKGDRIFTSTQKLEYTTGGPLTGYTYIVRMGQNLFEAPLTYYNKAHQWDLSPGYGAKDVGFSRPIPTGCLACHNGQPTPAPNREGMYRDPPFRFNEYGIGCECCHGPGQLHVALLTKHPKRKYGKPDPTIVNPAKLPARLANDLCMSCHQRGTTYVLQPGKTIMDFRPGTPLYETLALFILPVTPDKRAELNRLETLPPVRGSLAAPMWWKNYNLEMSRCFHDSGGQLRCITCHVIHHPPAADNKVEYYREKCFTCHNNDSCKLTVAERMSHNPPNNCVGCHMPRKPTAGIPHSDDTNHRIMRRPGEPYPDFAFSEPTADLPGLVCINREGEDLTRPMPVLTKLEAYGEAALKDPSLTHYYYDLLDQLRTTLPNDPTVLACLGRKAILEKQDAKAVDDLTRALHNGAGYAATYIDLSEALANLGRVKESAEILEQGAAVWPFSADIQKALVLRYVTLKQYSDAEEILQRYLALFPEDSFMRGIMAKVEALNP